MLLQNARLFDKVVKRMFSENLLKQSISSNLILEKFSTKISEIPYLIFRNAFESQIECVARIFYQILFNKGIMLARLHHIFDVFIIIVALKRYAI